MKLKVNQKALRKIETIYLVKWAIRGVILGSLMLYGYNKSNEEDKEIILITQSADQIEAEKKQAELDAFYKEAYDHINWVNPSYGVVTIDNKKFNVSELKDTYGPLYSFIDPLTEEEIESRFEYLLWYSEIMNANYLNEYEFFGGYKNNEDVKYIGTGFQDMYATILMKSNGLFDEYKNNYNVNNATFKTPFDNNGYVFMDPSATWNASIKDKEYMVRVFTYYYNTNLMALRHMNVKPEYFFEVSLEEQLVKTK